MRLVEIRPLFRQLFRQFFHPLFRQFSRPFFQCPRLWWVCALCACGVLASCAAPPRLPPSLDPQWRGKLSLTIASDPPQSTSAAFTLTGNARAGTLDLYGPLGSQEAQLTWQPQLAQISNGKTHKTYPDIESALLQLTGANIPLDNFFGWLQGQDPPTSVNATGWQVDLARFNDGRITARRIWPSPYIELRVILEPQ